MKISIIGAGLVGTTTCEKIALKNIADEIVLVDIHKESIEGKVMDLMQSKVINDFKTNITAIYDDKTENSYVNTADSNIGIITCGIPRKPGMTRDQLICINSNIVLSVGKKLQKHSPDIILIVVTNPVDIMSYLLHLELNLPTKRIIGMGGILDTARFKYNIINTLKLTNEKINAFVIGAHSDTHMIPLVNHVTIDNNKLQDLIDTDSISTIVENTKLGGAIITNKLGYSAGYAPAAAITLLVETIINDSQKILPCSVLLQGEYGVNNMCIGTPVVIGKNGIENIIELKLSTDEQELLDNTVVDLKIKSRNILSYT